MRAQFLSRFLAVLGCLAMSTAALSAYSWLGSGSSSNPYLITSKADLEALADEVNSGTTHAGHYFRLETDIDTYAKPIGYKTSNDEKAMFCGAFDGNGRIIDLAISNTYDADSGVKIFKNALFELLGPGAYVHDLTVTGYVMTSLSGTAGIAADADGSIQNHARIENCLNEATIISNSFYIAGIAAQASYTDVISCVNSGEIRSNMTSGNPHVGGVVGSLLYGKVCNCSNMGDIYASSTTWESYVGGIVGLMTHGAEVHNVANFALLKLGGPATYQKDYCGVIVGCVCGNDAIVDHAFWLEGSPYNNDPFGQAFNTKATFSHIYTMYGDLMFDGAVIDGHDLTDNVDIALSNYAEDNGLPLWKQDGVFWAYTPATIISYYHVNLRTPAKGEILSPEDGKVYRQGTFIPLTYTCDDGSTACWEFEDVNPTLVEGGFLMPGQDVMVAVGQHTPEYVAATEPTCTTGHIGHWRCTKCGRAFADEACTHELTASQLSTALGHNTTYIEALAPTCTDTGLDAHWQCTRCGDLFLDAEALHPITLEALTIPANGHTLKYISGKAPTCLYEGRLEYWHCTVCDKYYTDEACTHEITFDETIIQPLGHEYDDNGFCIRCGKYEPPLEVDGFNEIHNLGQLLSYAQHNFSYSGDYNGRLMADITVNENVLVDGVLNPDPKVVASFRSWQPLGLGVGPIFSGTFDGNGHSISGLYVNSGSNAVGFISDTQSGALVKDLTILDSYFCTSGNYAGAIIGETYYANIVGCTAEACVVAKLGYAGGICGNISGQNSITDCHASGVVMGAGYLGGITGQSSCDISRCTSDVTVIGTADYIGGIVGYTRRDDITISDCINNGTVTAGNENLYVNFVGGIVGHNTAYVTRCINNGAVILNDSANPEAASPSSSVGGIVGINYQKVTDCCNTGTVTATGNARFVGGVVGNNNNSRTNYCVVRNCYNVGTVSGPAYVGSVCGFSSGNLSNSHYLTGTATDGNGTVMTGESDRSNEAHVDDLTRTRPWTDFSTGAVCYALNGSTSEGDLIWYQTLGTQATPQFSGSVVYYDADNDVYTNTLPGPAYEAGDVNGDHTIDVSDVTALVSVILGSPKAEDLLGDPDVNGDHTIDVSDVTALVSIILGATL